MFTSSNPAMELCTLHFPSRQGGGKGADSSNFDTDMHIAHAFPELEDGVMQDNVAVGRTS